MDYKYFTTRVERILKENALLKFSLLVLACANIIFGYLTFRAVKYQKVVLIPYGFNKEIEVNGDQLSEAYIYEMARIIFDLALNYSPASVKTQYELLLTMWDPETYKKYKELFSKIEEEASVGRLISLFIPLSIQHNPDKKLVKAFGKKILLLEGEKVAESKSAEYAFFYRVRAGRLYIREFGEWKKLQKEFSQQEIQNDK